MSALIEGIHHVCVKCKSGADYEKTLSFYRDTLGLAVVRSWGEGKSAGAHLDAGGGLIEIFANAADAPGQGAVRHFSLKTSDVDACAKAVKDAGYEVFLPPRDITIASDLPYPARIAFCRGPVGEEIEFFDEK